MPTVILNDEQAQIVRTSASVEFQDRSGKIIGRYVPADLEEDIRIAKERLANPGKTYTTEEVLEHIRSLAAE